MYPELLSEINYSLLFDVNFVPQLTEIVITQSFFLRMRFPVTRGSVFDLGPNGSRFLTIQRAIVKFKRNDNFYIVIGCQGDDASGGQ